MRTKTENKVDERQFSNHIFQYTDRYFLFLSIFK